MREHEVVIPSAFGLAGVLCMPEDALRPPAVLLLGGSGSDTRDGDLEPGWPAGTTGLPAPGTLRRIAHHLAHDGIASLRWDRRGFGKSGGKADESDYTTDLEDALAALEWLRPQVGPVAVAGHSAGALTACRVCRDGDDVAGAIFLGALASPIEDMLRWNVGRIGRHWDGFTDEQRAWLVAELPAHVLRGEGVERYLAACRRGDASVTLEGYGVTVELRTARTRQDLVTSYEGEFEVVRCPALVLHGGEDLNVPVADAWTAYQALRRAGNADVQLVVLPGLDHHFHPVGPDPIWERVSLESLRRPMSPDALEVITGWAVRWLA